MKLTESQLRKLIKEELQAISPIHQLERIHGILRNISMTLGNDARSQQLMKHNLEGLEALHNHLKNKLQKSKQNQPEQQVTKPLNGRK